MSKQWGHEDKTVPAGAAFVVSPDDNADLPTIARCLYIGGGGNLKVILERDTAPVTFIGLAAGTFAPIHVKRVYNTDTTCTNILGLL